MRTRDRFRLGRPPLNSVQIPAKANSGRSSLSAGRTVEEFVRLFNRQANQNPVNVQLVIAVFDKHLSE
jgi:hypothetical protein